MSFKSFAAAPI